MELLNAWGARFAESAQPMLVQSAALVGLLLAADFVLRKKTRAGLRYALWMLVLVKLVLPPTLTLPTSIAYWLPKEAPAAAAPFLSAEAPAPASAAVAAVAQPGASARQKPLTWPGILLLLWFSVAVALAVRVAWHFRGAHRQVRNTTAPPAAALELLEECRARLGLPHLVHLRAAPGTISPAVFGIFRPVVVLSSELLEKLSTSELRSILLHELAHVKRGDLWINHLQILLQVFYWYNPAVWLANAMIRRTREQAVDETVLVALKDEAETYPSTLVQVARLALPSPGMRLGFVGILERGSSLNQRIRHMLNHPAPKTARLGIFGALLVSFVALLALPMGRHSVAAESARAEEAGDVTAEVLSGRALTPVEVQELEKVSSENPENISARHRLIGYYNGQPRSDEARQAKQKHILWLIENRPEAEFHSHGWGLLPMRDGRAYEQGRDLWLDHVRKHSSNPKIAGHAAKYLLHSEQEIAEELLEQARKLEPENPEWPWELAQLHHRNAKYADTARRVQEATEALKLMELAQANTKEEIAQFYNLDYLSSMALTAGDYEKAKEYATEFLKQAQDHPGDWASGNAVHNGNVILGHVALENGNVAEAKKHLLAAGQSEGSPQLNSFGPTMTLAQALLEKGEDQVVLEYLEAVSSFWRSGADRLERWKKLIDAGVAPDFGANLR